MIICKCLVCGTKWTYEDEIDEDTIRACCAPCGHQGCFEIISHKDYENKGEL